jgi:hypothetical protein
MAIALVDRSLSALERLLQSGCDPNEEGFGCPGGESWRQSLLRLALGWPPGLQALLRAGADPVVAAEDAIRFGDDTAVRLLVEYDCPMSHPMSYEGGDILLDMLKFCPLKQKTINLAIAKLADQRGRLWTLAQQNLSPREISRLGISLRQGEVLDADCAVIQDVLSNRGIYIPLALRVSPAKHRTVYNSTNPMSQKFAQKLFDAGFKSVDPCDHTSNGSSSYGPTPFLNACRQGEFELADWFLKMGARSRIDREEIPWIAQCLLASSFPNAGFGSESIKQLRLLQNLKKDNGPFESDRCACYCSPDGCTPITTLHKRLSNDTQWRSTWSRKIYCLQSWLEWGDFDSVETSIAWKAFCRLEIFTRLGMAHTCCKYGYHFSNVRIVTPDEQSELQDEDTKAGFVSKLEYFMDEYTKLEAKHIGLFDEFLASWWSYLDGVLDYNEMRKGFYEVYGKKRTDSGEYFDCDSKVFFMTSGELRELCLRDYEESSNEESEVGSIEELGGFEE